MFFRIASTVIILKRLRQCLPGIFMMLFKKIAFTIGMPARIIKKGSLLITPPGRVGNILVPDTKKSTTFILGVSEVRLFKKDSLH